MPPTRSDTDRAHDDPLVARFYGLLEASSRPTPSCPTKSAWTSSIWPRDRRRGRRARRDRPLLAQPSRAGRPAQANHPHARRPRPVPVRGAGRHRRQAHGARQGQPVPHRRARTRRGDLVNALVLHLDGMRVPVETAGSSRKARLTIEADGAPLAGRRGHCRRRAEQFLISKRAWIYRKLAEKEALQHEPVTKELVNGEGFSYLGRSHRLQLDDATAGAAGARTAGASATRKLTREPSRSSSGTGGAGRHGSSHAPGRGPNGFASTRSHRGGRSRHTSGGAPRPDGMCGFTGRPCSSRRLWSTTSSPTSWPISGNRTMASFWQLLARAMPDYEERKVQLARKGSRLWMGDSKA